MSNIDSTFIIASLCLMFFFTHIFLGIQPIRKKIVKNFGELGFNIIFFIVAEVIFIVTLKFLEYGPSSQFEPIGFKFSQLITLTLSGVISIGILLMTVGVLQYLASPAIPYRDGKIMVKGIFKVCRHPIFLGQSLILLPHLFLASSLNLQIFFIFFGSYSLLGMYIQDKKLLDRHGSRYKEIMDKTSLIPFLSIVKKEQNISIHDIPIFYLFLGLTLTYLLRGAHHFFLEYNGVDLIIAGFFFGPAYFTFNTLKKHNPKIITKY